MRVGFVLVQRDESAEVLAEARHRGVRQRTRVVQRLAVREWGQAAVEVQILVPHADDFDAGPGQRVRQPLESALIGVLVHPNQNTSSRVEDHDISAFNGRSVARQIDYPLDPRADVAQPRSFRVAPVVAKAAHEQCLADETGVPGEHLAVRLDLGLRRKQVDAAIREQLPQASVLLDEPLLGRGPLGSGCWSSSGGKSSNVISMALLPSWTMAARSFPNSSWTRMVSMCLFAGSLGTRQAIPTRSADSFISL